MSDNWQRRLAEVCLVIASFALGWPLSALAGTDCGNDLESIASARIVGSSVRVYFVLGQSDKPTCPSTAPKCRAKAYVVPGDEVLVGSSSTNGFQCATYQSPAGVETSGFLPTAAIALSPHVEVQPVGWVGTWRRDTSASIKLTPAKDGQAIKVDGHATWGSGDPQRVKQGSVHEGNLDETAVPHGNLIALGEGYDGSSSPDPDKSDCLARLRLFGRYLVVEDNHNCGGVNVSFDGVYTR
jgi:hypothetical protein